MPCSFRYFVRRPTCSISSSASQLPKTFPLPLSAQDEREYFTRARAGDAQARDKLIEHNLRLVAHIVRKYYGSSRNSEDLVSIGSIGLIKAIDSFKPENGARFATYAAKCIQNEILMYFRAQKKLGCEVSTTRPSTPTVTATR